MEYSTIIVAPRSCKVQTRRVLAVTPHNFTRPQSISDVLPFQPMVGLHGLQDRLLPPISLPYLIMQPLLIVQRLAASDHLLIIYWKALFHLETTDAGGKSRRHETTKT